jgi:hypothetical protein
VTKTQTLPVTMHTLRFDKRTGKLVSHEIETVTMQTIAVRKP